MYRLLPAIAVALLVLSCGKAPPPPRDTPRGSDAPAASSANSASPSRSAPIKPPQLTMKAVAKDDRSTKATAIADPFLPTGSERPRLPMDFVIGELGRAGASAEAYRFAMDFLSVVTKGGDATAFYSERGRSDAAAAARLLSTVLPASARIGGGVASADGEVSFLVRFVGKDRSVAGELHLLRSSSWRVDAFILDNPVDDYESDGSARFDPFTYTRFL